MGLAMSNLPRQIWRISLHHPGVMPLSGLEIFVFFLEGFSIAVYFQLSIIVSPAEGRGDSPHRSEPDPPSDPDINPLRVNDLQRVFC